MYIIPKHYLQATIASLVPLQEVAPIRCCTFCRSVYVQDRDCPGCGARDWEIVGAGSRDLAGKQFELTVDPAITISSQQSFHADFQRGRPYRVRDRFRMWLHLGGLRAWGVL